MSERVSLFPRETRWPRILLILVLVMIPLLLRVTGLGVFVTIDEPTWAARSQDFHDALVEGDFFHTYQSEHPGVVTMWIGILALRVSQAAEAFTSQYRVLHVLWEAVSSGNAGLPAFTFWARWGVALVTWMGILMLYFPLRRLFGQPAALLAILLVGIDPFYLAHSRLHHLDGLLTTFVMLSVTSLLASREGDRHRQRYLIFSGICGGLAMANKSPAVLLIPWIIVALIVDAWQRGGEARGPRLGRAIKRMVVWGLVAVGTVFILWPAMWVRPLAVMRRLMEGALRQGMNPHEHGNFFWFENRADPGPGFYPVAWAFRTTPLVVLGLVGLGLGERGDARRRHILLLLLFVAGYVAFMTTSSKKFDRYILPVFPLLDILAALGFDTLCDHTVMDTQSIGLFSLMRRGASRLGGIGAVSTSILITLLVAGIQLPLILPTYPYYLAYYNDMLGGGSVASDILLYGWGEGLDEAAAYLNSKPEASRLHVAAHYINQFSPFFEGTATLAGRAPLVEPDYFVLYSCAVQRQFVPEVMGRLYEVEEPEYTVCVKGLEYAWIYPNTFYRAETEEILCYIEEKYPGEEQVVIFDADAAWRKDYRGPLSLFVLAGPPREDFVLTMLEHASADERRVWFLTFPEMFEETDALVHEYLGRQGERGEEVAVGDVRAVCYEFDDHATFVPSPMMRRTFYLGEDIRLLGYDLAEAELSPGETLPVRFYWEGEGATGKSYHVFVHLLGPDGQMYGQDDALPQQGVMPTTRWQAGEVILDDHRVTIEEDAPPGEYHIVLGMYDLETMQRLPILDADGKPLGKDQILIQGVRISPDG
ncbi:MAG: ArnT family glycosyltransferase [Anaerolineales bacterium]